VREFESLLYEKLKKQIEQDCDIKITMTRTEVGGYCENCRK
jgi:Fe2+ or Zn2+ uptake regulation protein